MGPNRTNRTHATYVCRRRTAIPRLTELGDGSWCPAPEELISARSEVFDPFRQPKNPRNSLEKLANGVPAPVDQGIARGLPGHGLDFPASKTDLLGNEVDRELEAWLRLDRGRNLGDILPGGDQAGEPDGSAVSKEDLGKSFRHDGLKAGLLDRLGRVLA